MNSLLIPRVRAIMFVIVATVLLALWAFLLYLPQRQRQAAILQTIQNASGELTHLQQTLQQLPAYLAALDSTTKQRAALAQKLYTPEEIVSLLGDIRELAQSEGLQVLELHPPLDEYLLYSSRVAANPDSSILSIRVLADGKFLQYGRFLKQLENRAYFRSLTAQQLTADPDRSPDKLHLELVCRVLMARNEEPTRGAKG